ncbi:MAG: pyruvate carboxyltransferase [Desulfocapsaceae bacterium]|nr:pyruvate carboxyltransferase [Desulfocapsaceae bacterium]
MEKPVHLIDTTLREGEQSVGISFTTPQKKAIINGLALVGVSELEAGIASSFGSDLQEIIDFCRRHHPQLMTSLWCRCRKKDILAAASLGPDRLSLSIPVSDLHLTRRLGKNRSWAEDTMVSAIDFSRQKRLAVSIGFEDATRAARDFLHHMARRAEQAGAFRIRLADTVGQATPTTMIALVTEMKKSLQKCELAVHTHNDFGMATANAMAALDAGAGWADVTILGLGERAGCARLEELAGYLGIMRSAPGIDARYLKPLAASVSGIIATTREDYRPLVGDKIFTCETGLHLQGLQKDPSTYEPYPPELVGATRRLLLGAKCGRQALKTRLAELGHTLDDDQLLQKTRTLRDRAALSGRSLDDQEILAHILS